MASDSPQVEDGFVRIATELFRAIRLSGFSKRELLIVLAVMQKTYGFNKKSDDMTMTQLASETDLKLPHVSATVRDLEKKNVLQVRPGEYGKVIGINKSYRTWKREIESDEVTETVTKHVTETVIDDQNSHVTKSVTQVTETVSEHVTETVIECDRNGQLELPNQSFHVTKTVNTIDTPNRQLQKTIPKDSSAEAVPTAATWAAYAAAYEAEYRFPPTRNAKVNGQLAKFCQRVPHDEAPQIAAFYVRHKAAFYVRTGHAVGALLNDAEKLRTEWATNTRMTETRARQGDQTEAQGQVWQRLLEKAENL